MFGCGCASPPRAVEWNTIGSGNHAESRSPGFFLPAQRSSPSISVSSSGRGGTWWLEAIATGDASAELKPRPAKGSSGDKVSEAGNFI